MNLLAFLLLTINIWLFMNLWYNILLNGMVSFKPMNSNLIDIIMHSCNLSISKSLSVLSFVVSSHISSSDINLFLLAAEIPSTS